MTSPLTAARLVFRSKRPAGKRGLFRARFCGLSAVLLLSACASAPKPTEIDGSLRTSETVNPSINRRPSPLLVRLYELKTVSAFNNADFVSLYQRDQAELGADLVAREEFVMSPGESRPIKRIAAPETRFIGVLAAYRDLDRAQWRLVVPVQPARKQTITITAGELAITAVVAP